MIRTLISLAVIDAASFCINFITILSNDWFFLGMRNNNCLTTLIDSCLLPGYKKVFTFGYWYLCPLDTKSSTNWVFDQNAKQCLPMKTHNPSLSRLRFSNMIAKVFKNSQLLDIELKYADVIQALSMVGTVLLFSICSILIGMLMYVVVIGKENFRYRAEFRVFKPLFEAVFFLHLLEISTRGTFFILISVNANEYLDYIIRTSYTTLTGSFVCIFQ